MSERYRSGDSVSVPGETSRLHVKVVVLCGREDLMSRNAMIDFNDACNGIMGCFALRKIINQ